MPTNQQRAAEIIGKVMSRWDMDGRPDVPGGIDTCLAQALADAGLITPDLPEPELPGLWEVDGLEINLVDKDGDVCIEWEADSDYIYGKQTRTLWLNRDQVLAILAAAEHMEKNE